MKRIDGIRMRWRQWMAWLRGTNHGLGARYWTILKYLSLLFVVYTAVTVMLGWSSYRSVIVWPLLVVLALWIPRPLSWCLLMASLVIGSVDHAVTGIQGLNYVGTVHMLGWGKVSGAEFWAGHGILSLWFGLTAIYFWRGRAWFRVKGAELMWLKVPGAVLGVLLVTLLPRAERVFDPGWAARDMRTYAAYFKSSERQAPAYPKVTLEHSHAVTALAWSPDSRYLATTAMLVKSLSIWDVRTAKLIRTINRGGAWSNALAFSPDGRFIATEPAISSNFENRVAVSLWDVQTGEVARHVTGPFGPSTTDKLPVANRANLVAWSPDGHYFAAVFIGTRTRPGERIGIYDARSWTLLRTFGAASPSHPWTIAFSPDSRYLVTGNSGGTINIWDVLSGELARKIVAYHDPPIGWAVTSVAVSPDGKHFVSGPAVAALGTGASEDTAEYKTIAERAKQKVIRKWDAESGRLTGEFQGHTDKVRSIAYTPNGKYIVSGGYDGVRIWDAETGKLEATYPGFYSAMAVSPNGALFAAGGDSRVTVWTLNRSTQAK